MYDGKDIKGSDIKQTVETFLTNIFRGSFLGTFIADAYTKDEAFEIAAALDEICAPTDTVGWSSSGIYCFWDFYSKDILYIGLATDLPTRFRQHNGIQKTNQQNSKYKDIRDYFSKHRILGYSIFPQSSLAQPEVSRNKQIFNYDGYEYITEESKETIEIVEGCFIESFHKAYGHLPHWNQMGGSTMGQRRASLELYELLYSGFTRDTDNLCVARSSLREIAGNSIYERNELYLHAVRMSMLSRFLSFDEAVLEHRRASSFFSLIFDEILSSHYLAKEPQLRRQHDKDK